MLTETQINKISSIDENVVYSQDKNPEQRCEIQCRYPILHKLHSSPLMSIGIPIVVVFIGIVGFSYFFGSTK